jgi:hypothetical protein
MNYEHNKPIETIFDLPFDKEGLLEMEEKEREIGIEIELELKNAPSVISFWTTHSDGSIHAPPGFTGVEYVLKQPLSRKWAKRALNHLEGKLRDAGTIFLNSSRTSVHIHLNCIGMSIRQIYTLATLYYVFEEILVDYISPERAGNLFCLRLKDAEFQLTSLREGIEKGYPNLLIDHDLRYSALNFASLPKFGSLEFRAMRSTTKTEDITRWLNYLLALKDAAKVYSSPIAVIEAFSALGAKTFLETTFPGDLAAPLSEGRNTTEMMYAGIRLIQDIAYASEWPDDTSTPPKGRGRAKKKVPNSFSGSYYFPDPNFGNLPNDDNA